MQQVRFTTNYIYRGIVDAAVTEVQFRNELNKVTKDDIQGYIDRIERPFLQNRDCVLVSTTWEIRYV